MGFLQNRISELNSALINIIGGKVYVDGFYNEQQLLNHLENNINNFMSKGIYDFEEFNFNSAKTNALFIIRKDGIETKKVKFIHVLKDTLKLRDVNNKELVTITKNAFGEEYLVKAEKYNLLMKNISELTNFLEEKYKDVPILRSESNLPFAVIDFEIANSNYNSACSLGIVTIEGLRIVNKEYFLIQPPNMKLDPEMTRVHGITKNDLVNAPTFEQIWPKIKKYFTGGYIIAAHNAYFDVNVLKNCVENLDDTEVDFLYFDTIQYTNPVCKGHGTSLSDRLAYFNIELKNAHNALEDAIATADLIIKSTASTKFKFIEQFLLANNIPVKEFIDINQTKKFIKRSNFKKFNIKLSDIIPETDSFDENHPFFKKNIVFTGELNNLSRKDAIQAVANIGGILKSGVSKSTDFLVVGEQDLSIVGEKGVSSKEVKAKELIEIGYQIKILNEERFLDLLNNSLVID